jgi:hypothetical protein
MANLESAVDDFVKHELGLYDSSSGESIVAYKIIDATVLCPLSKRCVIKYAIDSIGKVAQINEWYDRDVDLGSSVHYHINNLTVHELSTDLVFMSFANKLGINPSNFAYFIYNNQ